MIELYEHQKVGVKFLVERPSALLSDCMGLGKTRTALMAAAKLFEQRKIDRVLVLCPAAVRYSWQEELAKLGAQGFNANILRYDAKRQQFLIERVDGNLNDNRRHLPIALVSYALLPQKRHVEALAKWCLTGKAALICDESSFLKNRTAKQTKGAKVIAGMCSFCWLLTGTPIANSPLDLYGQGIVMSGENGKGPGGPLRGFANWYHFQARYAVLKQMNMGQIRFKQVVGYQNLDELTKRFAPYVLRREKKDCLDLPPKSYVVREIALSEATWKIYVELKREALLCLPDSEERPEPNAATRILRLAQLTSGHVGGVWYGNGDNPMNATDGYPIKQTSGDEDVSSEKLDWLCDAILNGELVSERALIAWCRWRRERERLYSMLDNHKELYLYQIYGGQSQNERDFSLKGFTVQDSVKSNRNILLAQPHAGGFGLNLTAASTAVYLSNDFSYTTRVQSEDRCHRIGQTRNVLYVDVVATGPRGQRTVDAHVLDCLRAKKDIATQTCKAWRKVLGDD